MKHIHQGQLEDNGPFSKTLTEKEPEKNSQVFFILEFLLFVFVYFGTCWTPTPHDRCMSTDLVEQTGLCFVQHEKKKFYKLHYFSATNLFRVKNREGVFRSTTALANLLSSS